MGDAVKVAVALARDALEGEGEREGEREGVREGEGVPVAELTEPVGPIVALPVALGVCEGVNVNVDEFVAELELEAAVALVRVEVRVEAAERVRLATEEEEEVAVRETAEREEVAVGERVRALTVADKVRALTVAVEDKVRAAERVGEAVCVLVGLAEPGAAKSIRRRVVRDMANLNEGGVGFRRLQRAGAATGGGCSCDGGQGPK